MRVGTICFATERGLGYLAKSFYDHGVVTDVAVIAHGGIPTQWHWYPNSLHITKRPWLNEEFREMIASLDAMLFFETPFDWEIINECKRQGVLTALMTMYECTPKKLPVVPDKFLCPSLLDMDYFPSEKSTFIPVPVEIPWEQRVRAESFVHNSGYIGLKGRNGTREVLEAIQYVQSPIKLTVRSQSPEIKRIVKNAPWIEEDERVEVHFGTVPYESLLENSDVSLCPEKFNGLSLPIQEARASGCLVMTTNRFPMNTWLPKGSLIPVKSYRQQRVASRFLTFDEALIDPRAIASTIDAWYGEDITEYSQSGKEWAEGMTWDILKPRYLEALGSR